MWVGLTFLTLLTLHSTTTERTTERMREVPAEFRLVWYSCYSANWNSASTPVIFAILSAVVLQRVRSARNLSPAHIPRAPPHAPSPHLPTCVLSLACISLSYMSAHSMPAPPPLYHMHACLPTCP